MSIDSEKLCKGCQAVNEESSRYCRMCGSSDFVAREPEASPEIAEKPKATISHIVKTFDDMTGKGQINSTNFMLYKDKSFMLGDDTLQYSAAVVITDEGEKVGWMIFSAKFKFDWKFDDDLSMFALVDGERFRFDGMLRNEDSNYMSSGDYWVYDEEVHVNVDLDFFKKSSEASEVKIRVAGMDCILTEDMKEAMRQLHEAAIAI